MEKIKNFFKENQKILLVLGLVLAIFLISIFPPSGDDFNRLGEGFIGLGPGLDRIARLYRSLNGRVLGNEISYLFISRLHRTIFKALTIFLYIRLMLRLLDIQSLAGLLIIGSSVLLMPQGLFRQVLVWNSGFYNYFPPLVLILLVSYILIYHRQDFTRGELAMVFFISLSASLFMENLTIYMLVLPLLTRLCFYNEDSKKGYLASFLGSLAGAIIMFSSPVYRKVLTGEDGYRDLAQNYLDFILDQWPVFGKYLLAFNILVLVLMAFALIFGIYREKRKGRRTVQALSLVLLLGLVPLAFLSKTKALALVGLIGHVLFYLSLLYLAIKERGMEGFSPRMLVFASLSMAVAMGPLLFVSPINTRNFLTPMVFNIMIIISLFRINGWPKKAEKLLSKVLTILMGLVFLLYLVVYSINYGAYMERDRIIRQAIEDDLDEVTIPSYPIQGFNGDGGTDLMENYYYKEKEGDLQIEID